MNRIATRKDLDRVAAGRTAAAEKRQLRFHVCMGASCIASGATEVLEALEAELAGRNGTVEVSGTGCMGPCVRGPVLRVLPAGDTFTGVRAGDVAEIVARSFGETGPDAPAPDATLEDFFAPQRRIVLRNCGSIDPAAIEDAIARGAYAALERVISGMSPEDIVATMKESGLRGRGGAGFPTWLKWDLTRKADGEVKFVLCNADEGDPGAFMDRSVLEGDPHSLIEGMAIAARCVGATQGVVYVRAEYPLAIERLEHALGQAREAGLLGESIFGSDFSFDLEIRRGSGAFVCGEETALINSIEGKRGEPRPRPPFPAQKGLWGKPSLLNNVETYANVAAIFANGAPWFAAHGTPESRGTKVFALAGAIENTGLVEVPIGTTLGELVYDIGGGVKGGRPFKAAQIGGPSGGCVPRDHLDVPLDYESLQELGAIMGSGGLIVMDDETCMVDVARFFLEFVQEESCGKCVPCRVGTKRMLEILDRITSGGGEMEDIDRLVELGHQIKETALCGLGQTAPNPVLSTIRHFRDEYEEHIRDRHCAAGVCPGLVRAPCESACPAGVDVPGFVALVGERRYAEALALHRNRNPFAAVCARVCFHTCEDHCRRASLDDPVAIRGIKRFMVDQEVVIQLPTVRENEENAARKVAIVGAGPAGLSCAYFLARLGYRPTVFEGESRPGGMLVQTIPAYRLPRETLAREIRMIEQLGVDIRTETKLGRDINLAGLRAEGYEALFLGFGAPECVGMGIDGEEAAGVVRAGDFLRQYNIRGSVPVGKDVVVVGGGNAAVDAARTALRLGAESVTIIYRRTREQM
ncbi:MAG: NADH-quinone oxidoreductase subunit NuoF, partial [Spirochaetota bacterium]